MKNANYHLLLIFTLLSFLFSSISEASNRYWISDSTGFWNDPANWATSINGNGGASVPDANDDVYFRDHQGNCILSTDVSIESLQIKNYNGRIDVAGYKLQCSKQVKLYTGIIDDSVGSGLLSVNSSNNSYFEGTVINAVVNIVASGIYFHGSVFNGISEFEQTGNSAINSKGGNVFNAQTKIVKSGKGAIKLAKQNSDVFNDDVIFTNLNSSYFQISHDAGISLFFGDVILNSNNSDGFRFGNSGGYTVLSDTSVLKTGSLGFDSGEIDLKNTTVSSYDSVILYLTGTATANFDDDVFNGPVSVKASTIELQDVDFKGDLMIEKTGNSNDICEGENTFEGNVTIINNGTGYLKMLNSNSSIDYFKGDVTFINRNSGGFYIANRGITLIEGDLNIENNANMYIGNNGGIVTFTGTRDQYITNLSGINLLPYFNEMVVNKSGGDLILNTPVEIDDKLILWYGHIKTDTINTILFRNNAEIESASVSSHIIGPVYKVGNDAFTFPVGTGDLYKPISITAPSSSTAVFYAEYIQEDPNTVYPDDQLEVSIEHVSDLEYWKLERLISTSTVKVSLSWDSSSGDITNPNDLIVSGWEDAKWMDYGNDSAGIYNTGNVASNAMNNLTSGILTASIKPVSYKVFTLGTVSNSNTLPIKLLYFNTACGNDSVIILSWATASEINNNYFTIFKSLDGINWEPIAKVNGQGNSSAVSEYEFRDRELENDNTKYFYKLSQTDFDGKYEEFEIVSIFCKLNLKDFKVFPNPATDYIDISFNNVFGSKLPLDILIYNPSGKLVKKLQIPIAKQQNFLNVDLPDLVSGTYYLQVKSGDLFFHTCPIIIKR